MDKYLHNVADLPTSQRSVVESIIGHSLHDDQQLYIVALDAAVTPSADVRRQAWHELQEIISEAQQNVRDSNISPEELERTIDEASDQIRYGE
jgi:hypothetical protein